MLYKHITAFRREMYDDLDTQVKQHPFRVTAPTQPQQEIMKRIAPTPINK